MSFGKMDRNNPVLLAFGDDRPMMTGPKGGNIGTLQTDGRSLIYHGSPIVGRIHPCAADRPRVVHDACPDARAWVDLHGWGHSPCTRVRINAGLRTLGLDHIQVWTDKGRVILSLPSGPRMMPDTGRVYISLTDGPMDEWGRYLEHANATPNGAQARRWIGFEKGNSWRIRSITAAPNDPGRFIVKFFRCLPWAYGGGTDRQEYTIGRTKCEVIR